MDGIIQFLLIGAILMIGIVRKLKQEADKNVPPPTVTPETEAEVLSPHPYNPYAPEEIIAPPKSSRKSKKKTPRPFLQGDQVGSSPADYSVRNTPTDAATDNEAENNSAADSEYAIHSADEARKAIIWSEILQRKY
ncbi:MAG: hypothetical protein LBM62_05950 [Mediterranea sp.]|jgi:hypothetical protein|nr:hypothetical protein [Mediterranea sp.]